MVRHLSSQEREEISRRLAQGQSLRAISRRLRRAPSTVSREVARNGGRGLYRGAPADRRAWREARRPKRCRLARHHRLRRAVAAKLARQWSPQQIAGWLRDTFPSDPAMQVSHETIYRSLFVQSWHIVWPFTVGATVLSVVCSVLAYPITLGALRAYRRRKEATD